jgi:hypothetical protein
LYERPIIQPGEAKALARTAKLFGPAIAVDVGYFRGHNHTASWEAAKEVSARVAIDMSGDRCSSPSNICSSGKIVGNSWALQAVFEQVERVAPTNATVLIQGDAKPANVALDINEFCGIVDNSSALRRDQDGEP